MMNTIMIVGGLIANAVVFGWYYFTKTRAKKADEPDLSVIKKATERQTEKLNDELNSKIVSIKKLSNKDLGDLLNKRK